MCQKKILKPAVFALINQRQMGLVDGDPRQPQYLAQRSRAVANLQQSKLRMMPLKL